jgi:hypothetical protein
MLFVATSSTADGDMLVIFNDSVSVVYLEAISCWLTWEYLETTVIDKKYIYDEIQNRWNTGNASQESNRNLCLPVLSLQT